MTRYCRKNSIRLQGYDYSQSGAYFITITTHKRMEWFGDVVDEVMQPSALGNIVLRHWGEIEGFYQNVECDSFVLMPNHVHCILVLHDLDGKRPTLGHVVGNFKAGVTRIAKRSEIEIDLDHPIWQRSYYEHIIRSHRRYQILRQYIDTNAQRWAIDSLNEKAV